MSPSDNSAVPRPSQFHRLSRAACESLGIDPVANARIDAALEQAVDVHVLIDNLAEVWRTSPQQVRELFRDHGMGAWLARAPEEVQSLDANLDSSPMDEDADGWHEWGGSQIRVRCMNPSLASGVAIGEPVDAALNAFLERVGGDPFVPLYRTGILEYYESFRCGQAPRIDDFVGERFGSQGPKFLISSGIGANEQFCHLLSELNNTRPDRKLVWVPVNSVKEMSRVPREADLTHTLFMEFSRSGITEETVKLHEFTPRDAARIVFANAGPLRSLAERDGNLALDLPDEVPGRFGRNKTPILLAPMHAAGMDTRAYFSRIEQVCHDAPLDDPASLPVRLAAYIREQQVRRSANHIYLGTNHPLLRHSADEFCQFWNEGANKGGNDILMSRYLGLPRDSHMNIEGVLANQRTKMAVFLLCTEPDSMPSPHALVSETIDPLNAQHSGLSASEQDLILSLANVRRCAELMPTILVAVSGVDADASALLGQLWADVTFVYSRLVGVDPGSNPEVKAVRTRAAAWLADKSTALDFLR